MVVGQLRPAKTTHAVQLEARNKAVWCSKPRVGLMQHAGESRYTYSCYDSASVCVKLRVGGCERERAYLRDGARLLYDDARIF